MAMTGKTLVDRVDIYTEYGVYVTSGGWNGLVAMPSLKTPDSNDWQEEDGVEEDLSAPVLDTKEATVSFACSSSASRLFAFISMLSDGAYHKFECLWIGRTYRLRLVSQPKLSYDPALGTFSLKLADDFPLPGYKYEAPESDVTPSGDYWLLPDPDVPDAGAMLTDYGVRVLSGTLSNVLSTPEVKKNLLRNIASEAGAEYDGDGPVTLKGKDVKLQCLMRAADLDGLWRNWDALLFDLVRPGERGLLPSAAGQAFPCRYKSCSVTAFSPEGRPWLQFTLTMTFTRDLRVYMGDWLLSSEAGELVTTEDGEDCIDMRPLSPLTAGGASPASAPTGLSVETYAEEGGIRKVKVSELDECSDLTGLWTLGTDSSNSSVKVSLEFVGEAARNANNAATNANAAAEGASQAADGALNAAENANQAAQSANTAADEAYTMMRDLENAADTAADAARAAEEAAQSAGDAAASANGAATNANAAAQACYEAIEALGDIASIQPITDEEIDGLLADFRFIDSFTVSASGEYPLTLDAQNTADGADITGSVDISEIGDDEITRIFNG